MANYCKFFRTDCDVLARPDGVSVCALKPVVCAFEQDGCAHSMPHQHCCVLGAARTPCPIIVEAGMLHCHYEHSVCWMRYPHVHCENVQCDEVNCVLHICD